MRIRTLAHLDHPGGLGYTGHMHRPVKIVLVLDTKLAPGTAGAYDRASRPIRLVPCKGGVRLWRAGRAGPLCQTPQSLRAHFQSLAFTARTRLTGAPCATETYWAECALFMDWCAWHATRNTQILALWGGA